MGTLTINNLACGAAVTTTTTQSIIQVNYGALYNWWAGSDSRSITSSDDWDVPTEYDYEVLIHYIDPSGTISSNVAGTPLKESGTTHWLSGTYATNSKLFNARGHGRRNNTSGTYQYITEDGYLWCSTPASGANGVLS